MQSGCCERLVGDFSKVNILYFNADDCQSTANICSRSGEPRWENLFDSPRRPQWASSVEWARADIIKPETYKPFLKDANAVVHTMGILLEADYKGVVQGRESIIGGLQRAFGPSKLGSQDPLQRKEGEPLKPQEKDGQWTYEFMNRDSGSFLHTKVLCCRYKTDIMAAIALAQETSREHVPTFVYISAAAGAPILPSRYISTKREAEALIGSSLPELRSIFVRPGFMYDSNRKFTLPIALGGIVGSELNTLLGGRLGFLGTMAQKPLKVDLVGEAVVEAISDDTTSGPLNIHKIEALATRAWRKSML